MTAKKVQNESLCAAQHVSLMVDKARADALKSDSKKWRSWDLTSRQLCDLELLMQGAFAPLKGFLGSADYQSVVDNMRLEDNSVWPIPVVLDVPEAYAKDLTLGEKLALRDPEGVMLAAITVREVYKADKEREALGVYKTKSLEHPGVRFLMEQTGPYYISGEIEGIELPKHYDYAYLRLSVEQVRAEFAKLGWRKIVAFQTRNPMHRAHVELTIRASQEADAKLLVHPVVGMTKPGDVDHYTRVRCYEAILKHYLPGSAMLALLPLAMRMAGPREALWHALIRKNYGCTHFIVGRDHAGPGADSTGKPFYGQYDAQELVTSFGNEIGITMVPFREMLYLEEEQRYVPENEVKKEQKVSSISGTELRKRLALGQDLPGWFTYPEVGLELRRTYPPRAKQGFTVFFTGLSGSGKSTIANVLLTKLLEIGGRSVTLLDGDIVRKNLSSELGFSKEHRDLNIRRIGFVASEITKGGGIAICAPIAPYDATRKEVRRMVSAGGGFILVHVATSLEVCESRDRKGLYAKARAGILKEFTGISDAYETPVDAEITLDTADMTPDEEAHRILMYLTQQGYLAGA